MGPVPVAAERVPSRHNGMTSLFAARDGGEQLGLTAIPGHQETTAGGAMQQAGGR